MALAGAYSGSSGIWAHLSGVLPFPGRKGNCHHLRLPAGLVSRYKGGGYSGIFLSVLFAGTACNTAFFPDDMDVCGGAFNHANPGNGFIYGNWLLIYCNRSFYPFIYQ